MYLNSHQHNTLVLQTNRQNKCASLIFDYNAGKKTCMPGVVVCPKLDSDSGIVIRYDCEDRSNSFNF